jgi:hypothetical protein
MRIEYGCSKVGYAACFVRYTTSDCNGNGILDRRDIFEGTSADCNANQIPDECDLAEGTSDDCNDNDVPDSCDRAILITSPPQAQAVCPGSAAEFSVSSAPATAYQWYKDGLPLSDGGNISGSQTDVLLIFSVQPADLGDYACEVTHGCIVAMSPVATLAPVEAPTVAEPPGEAEVCAGSSAALVATFDGDVTAYAWERYDEQTDTWVPYPGQDRVLTFAGPGPEDAGSYRCTGFDSCARSATTDAGTLTWYPRPVLAEQPANVCAAVGQDVTFTATVQEDPQFIPTYVWFKDDMFYAGPIEDDPALLIADVQPGDAGTYYAKIFYDSSCPTDTRHSELAVGTCPPCFFPGDLDEDADADLYDFAVLQECFGTTGEPGCDCADIDETNGSVDQNDFQLWEAAFTGPA